MKELKIKECLFCKQNPETEKGWLGTSVYHVVVAEINFSFKICNKHEGKRITDIRSALLEELIKQ